MKLGPNSRLLLTGNFDGSSRPEREPRDENEIDLGTEKAVED
jgi:hypothetical protein